MSRDDRWSTKNRRRKWRKQHYDYQNGKCYFCGGDMVIQTEKGAYSGMLASYHCTLEHVVPLWMGGADVFSNTVAACYGCNQKRDRFYNIPRPQDLTHPANTTRDELTTDDPHVIMRHLPTRGSSK